MSTTAKTIIIWAAIIVAVLIIIYGGVKLIAPGYIDKTKYVAKNPAVNFNQPRFGQYNLLPGVNISHSESQQMYSPYASGMNPAIKGSADINPEPQITQKGVNDLFSMFQQ